MSPDWTMLKKSGPQCNHADPWCSVSVCWNTRCPSEYSKHRLYTVCGRLNTHSFRNTHTVCTHTVISSNKHVGTGALFTGPPAGLRNAAASTQKARPGSADVVLCGARPKIHSQRNQYKPATVGPRRWRALVVLQLLILARLINPALIIVWYRPTELHEFYRWDGRCPKTEQVRGGICSIKSQGEHSLY